MERVVWTDWSPLGGQLTSGPAVMVRPSGIYNVFARGPANSYLRRYFSPATGWSAWADLGGNFASASSATYRQGTGEIDLFGTAVDNQLWFKSFSTAWSDWIPLAFFVRGPGNAIFIKSWVSGVG